MEDTLRHMVNGCVFCSIVEGTVPAERVYEEGAALLRVAECAGCGLVGVVAANRRGSLRLRSWLCDRNVEKEPEWKHMRWRRQGQRSAGRVTASRRWCRGWAARSRRGAPTRNWRHDCRSKAGSC